MRIAPVFRPVLLAASIAFGTLPAATLPAMAQSGPGWFVPHAGGSAAAPRPQSHPRERTHTTAAPAPSRMQPPPEEQPQAENETPPAPMHLPPVPDLPPLSRGSAPPAAVIGVLGIPDIMRASLAAKAIEKTIGERREKLNQDAQKEQAAWRDLQQQLANQRAHLSADQIRAKERELQERITNAQKQFRDRNRIIQEAGQYGLAQIERMLIAVIRQVAESRGMNLVLHRAQVALNVNEFDITQQVTDQLNKTLPSVVLPPEGVSPSKFMPATAEKAPAATEPKATPASAAPDAPKK